MQWREADGVRWLEAELGGARAAFSTRLGGASSAPFESLNCGISTEDEYRTVLENRSRLAETLGLEPTRVLSGHQVHGADLAIHNQPPHPSHWVKRIEPGTDRSFYDGQVTSTPGLAPAVTVADCLPVALAGPGGVAMLHCGWRGLAGGIVAEGVAAVGAEAAAIGPGIGPCCYEVGVEVLERFADLGEGIAEGRMLDLAEVARRQLRAAGVERVEAAGLCTKCEPELFYSHRRDGERSGRQAGVAWLVEAA